MSRLLITSLLILFFLYSGKAQIVNIESLRAIPDSAGFSGVENFNIDYTRNTNELFTLTNNLSLQYRQAKNVVLFLNTFDVSVANKEVLEQNIFFHLRYNYLVNSWLTYEALSQYQSNAPLRINHRVLTGIGPRFTLLKREQNSVYLGTIFLYEHDDEAGNDTIHRDVRLSAYLSYNLRIDKRFSWSTVVYYQPRIDYWEDFRTSVQTQLTFKIFRNLAFNSIFNMSYDAFPVMDPDIPNLTIKWTNGVSYRF